MPHWHCPVPDGLSGFVFACAELHEKQAELWDAFSKEARSNKTLAPYWELLAMFDGQGEGDRAGMGASA